MSTVCFFSGDISRSGGTERVATIIANTLIQFNYKVIIISLNKGETSYFDLNDNIKLYTLNKENTNLNYFRIIWKLRKIIKKEKVDVVIDIDTILSIFTLFSTCFMKIKRISWEHFNYYNSLGSIKRKLARKLVVKFYTNVIVLTKKDKKYFEENLHAKNIEYIYNPAPFCIKDEEKIIKKEKIAISVGRLTKIKGFDRLLDIWKKIEEIDKETWLYIVGSGEDKKNLLKKAKELKLTRIKFIENTKNIKQYYLKSKLYLMTSYNEGLPMTLIEAKSCGVPIISYDIRTGPSDIIEDNKSGFLIKNGDSEEFIKKTLILLKDDTKNKEFSEASLKEIDKFDLKTIIKEWIRIIEK